MFFLILNWIFLFFISGVIGIFLIKNTLNEVIDFDKGFYFVLSQLIGILFISYILLITSIVFPIKNTFILLVFFLSLIIYLTSKDLRLKFNEYFTVFNQIGKIKFTLLIGLIGVYESQIIFWGDSGNYHINAIRWLHEYGAVYGVANLIKQLGFTSSWFALNASLLMDGGYRGISYTVLGGYVLLLMIVHWIYCLKEITHEKEKNQFCTFYLFAYPLIILLIFRWGVALSPSPDMVINFMGLLVAGVLISDLKIESKSILIFLMAVLFLSVKVSAISLLIFSLYYMIKYYKNVNYKKLVLISLLVFPILVCNVIASGYPLYPNELFGLNVEWAVPKSELIHVSNSIYNHSFYNITAGNKIKQLEFNDFFRWLFSRKEWLTALLIFINIIGIYFLLLKDKIRYINIITFISISFIIFLLNAPTLRFGLIWLVIIPAISAAVVANKFVLYKLKYLYSYLTYFILISIALVIAYPINPMQIKLRNKYPNSEDLRFLFPPRLILFENVVGNDGRVKDVQDLKFSTFKIEGTEVYNGKGFCWDIDLPCSENLNINLINPENGISSGFRVQK